MRREDVDEKLLEELLKAAERIWSILTNLKASTRRMLNNTLSRLATIALFS
jgi:hypothetical protein